MERIRFAVIGCGALARSQHIPNLARSAVAALELCCDTSEEALADCRERYGVRTATDWPAAVADPRVDALCLATTEKLRYPVIEAAAKAGKPVYVEKPLANNLPEIYRIRDLLKAHPIPFCVGHNRRCSPAMAEARALFRAHMDRPVSAAWRWNREGSARPPRADDGAPSMNVRINDDWYSWKAWVFDPKQAPHGPMLFEMTHFTDLCNWFLASEPTEVMAMETGMLNHAILVRYAHGGIASLNLCANGTFAYPKELYEVMGHGAIVVCDHMCEVRTAGIPGAPATVTYPFLNDRHPDVGQEGGIAGWRAKKAAACREAEDTGDPMRQFTAEPDKGHARALDAFTEEIRGERDPVCGVDDAVRATRVAFAAIRSAAENRLVRLEEI